MAGWLMVFSFHITLSQKLLFYEIYIYFYKCLGCTGIASLLFLVVAMKINQGVEAIPFRLSEYLKPG